MNADKKLSIYLGFAFLLQFFTSLISGIIPSKVLPGNSLPTTEIVNLNLGNIAANEMIIRISMLGQIITSIGIVFLGSMLYIVLKKENKKAATVGFGLYILEAALLASSMIWTFMLLSISHESLISNSPSYLQTLGNISFHAMGFGMTIALLPFSIGAILFYYLFYKSKLIPRALSIWGIIGASIILLATLFTVLGQTIPMYIYIPYVPFELVVGL
jgi:hypothetical protein